MTIQDAKAVKIDGALEALAEQQQGARLELPIETLLGMKAPYNPRKIDGRAFDRLCESLRNFGVGEPITLNRRTTATGWPPGERAVIVGGHQRVAAAAVVGLESFPVFWGDWSAVDEKALNIALNNPNLQGRYDDEKLRDLLLAIGSEGGSIAHTGFDDLEIARFLKKIGGGATAPDDVPSDVEMRAQTGDRWVLGSHVLICGDATSQETLGRLWRPGEQPKICATDPPYGVEYDPGWRLKLQNDSGVIGGRRMGKVTNDDRADWSDVWRICGADVIYAWCAAGDLMIRAGLALETAGYDIRASIIWRKPNFPISRGHYTFTHEPCWYAVRSGATARWIGGDNAQTVWESKMDATVPGGHSTQKPVELFTNAIGNHDGDVFEPFCGSGTCLIACEQLGRRCFAVEISPHYCDVILARWEAFTGEKAVLDQRLEEPSETVGE